MVPVSGVNIGSVNGLWLAMPLPEPVLTFRAFEEKKLNSNQNTIVFFQEFHLKMSSANYQPFCLGLNVLTLCVLIFFQRNINMYLQFI